MTGSQSRVVLHFVAALASLAVLGAACGGRNLEDLVAAGQAEGGNDAGGNDNIGGSGGTIDVGPGVGGEGPGVGGEGPGAGGSTGPGGPIDCFGCIGDNCPEALECITDPTCAQGIACAVTDCLGGGNGPDIQCFLECFDGDFEAALAAFQALQCVFGSCIDECGDLFGGGFPGP